MELHLFTLLLVLLLFTPTESGDIALSPGGEILTDRFGCLREDLLPRLEQAPGFLHALELESFRKRSDDMHLVVYMNSLKHVGRFEIELTARMEQAVNCCYLGEIG
ncbi:hypothetical protein CYMTET_5502 [Cymbomonas tetramitiformis]|uniref:Secreted protein n=1 Tax=Cymbomonas tetramitiformis TaxID=36881 RepID=A0AAE0FC94_9CHLO|nr:hypothetical protein CYMTET_34100 [Cymbomonas tetramitiformis]KAK3286966.1 hypothetical protein CYMTET_5502 [Cymbomonas tetramitiformis]